MEFQAKDAFGRKFKGKVRVALPLGRLFSSLSWLLTVPTTLAQGELHVSTIRMVFVSNSGGDMQAFDLPMANITNEKFNQPIFGANNISGTVAAVRRAPCRHLSQPRLRLTPCVNYLSRAWQIANEQAGVTGQLEFKLWFNEGGCATFLRVFFQAMEQLRSIPIGAPLAAASPSSPSPPTALC
jgi:hypothetical protein